MSSNRNKHKTLKVFFYFLILVVFALASCTPTEPKIEKNITIREYDVAVMEAYIHLSFESKQKRNLQLYRDNNLIYNFVCNVKDTIIVDTALTESTRYKYVIKQVNRKTIIAESNEISIATLKPTSHNITWTVYDFEPQFSGGAFLDISVINENNIWAVGEFYLPDSIGNIDRERYAAAHWDGSKWNKMKVPYESTGNPNNPSYPGPLFSMYAVDENHIYACSYANLLEYRNDYWQRKAFFMKKLPYEWQVRRIWAENSNNIYCVGNNGAIFHVTNNGWQKIESNTTYYILDLCGYHNPLNDNLEILCAATTWGLSDNKEGNELLKITETDNVRHINIGTGRENSSVWTSKGYPVYVCGDGIFTNKTGKWKEVILGTHYYSNKINGSKLNDIFVVGAFGLVGHFNGKDWKVYNFATKYGFTFVSITKNTVAISGSDFSKNKAIIIIGKRN